MKSKQAYYSEEALDEAPREDCTAVKGCIYSRFVFLWVGGGVTVLLLKRKKKRRNGAMQENKIYLTKSHSALEIHTEKRRVGFVLY